MKGFWSTECTSGEYLNVRAPRDEVVATKEAIFGMETDSMLMFNCSNIKFWSLFPLLARVPHELVPCINKITFEFKTSR